MTRLLFINPNSTRSMTREIVTSAEAVAPDASIKGWTSLDGPPSIQGTDDGMAAYGPLLSLVEKVTDADAIVIACFDDTALTEAKRIANVPVIGIGEAAYHAAALAGRRFSVVTTLAVSVPVIEGNIKAGGFGHLCGQVRASNIPVLSLENDQQAFDIIAAQAREAFKDDGIDAVVLGCAGMTGLAQHLRRELGRPIIDGVEVATQLGRAMAKIARLS